MKTEYDCSNLDTISNMNCAYCYQLSAIIWKQLQVLNFIEWNYSPNDIGVELNTFIDM